MHFKKLNKKLAKLSLDKNDFLNVFLDIQVFFFKPRLKFLIVPNMKNAQFFLLLNYFITLALK